MCGTLTEKQQNNALDQMTNIVRSRSPYTGFLGTRRTSAVPLGTLLGTLNQDISWNLKFDLLLFIKFR